MKKLARSLGIVGGAAAVLWVVRDRLFTMVKPKEPEPPVFKVVPPVVQDLTVVNGIGPASAEKLKKAGINTLADLASANPGELAARIATPAAKVSNWVEQAKSLA